MEAPGSDVGSFVFCSLLKLFTNVYSIVPIWVWHDNFLGSNFALSFKTDSTVAFLPKKVELFCGS